MKKAFVILGSLLLTVMLSTGSVFAAEQVFFYITDPAGTPLAMTDSTGKVVWKADYKPFGEEQSVTATTPNNKRFIGKEKDEETGLEYFGARYMNNKTGRFISPDAVGPVDPRTSRTNEKLLLNPQRLNKYAYGLNNPYRFVDPDGNFPIDTIWDVGNVIYDVYKRDWPSAAADGGAMLIPYVPAGITKVAKGVDKAIDASNSAKGIKNVYNSVKDAGGEGFVAIQNGMKKYSVKNNDVLQELRKIEGGTWNKVYRDGFDEAGNKVSQHYFQSKSGKIFDFATKSGWSNK